MALHVTKDGIKGVGGYAEVNGLQIKKGNFYLLTYNRKYNMGYIGVVSGGKWRLYTKLGENVYGTRYHNFYTFKECYDRLLELAIKTHTEVILENE